MLYGQKRMNELTAATARMPTIANAIAAQKARKIESRRRSRRGRWGTARADIIATCRRCTSRTAAKAAAAASSRITLTTAPVSKSCWPITFL
ncbi:hypothetical protein D3C83_06460 [compost metagenome]